VLNKLNAIPGYKEQFNRVFGTDVTTDGIAKAIASFERSIISGPSPYDRWLDGDKSAMSPAAVRGLHLFHGKAHCSPCHSGPTFSNQEFHNLGAGMDKPNPDLGRFDHTKNPADRGRFKVPTLRNIALTPPYLHTGAEKTLLDVVEFYNRGGVPNPDLDPLMLPLHLTRQEKQDLVAFLEALSGSLPAIEPPVLPPGPDGPAPAEGRR
jgi:cytochrome c peroxidase